MSLSQRIMASAPPGGAPKRPLSTPEPPKKRRKITDFQRKALRDHYFIDTHQKATHKELITWFHDKFKHILSQSSISDCLAPTYKHLDGPISTRPGHARRRVSYWPDLEDALFEWQQRKQGQKATITGDILKEIAGRFWLSLPQYTGQEMPKWSTGWLDGFKARYNIKRYRQFSEAGAVNQVTAEVEL